MKNQVSSSSHWRLGALNPVEFTVSAEMMRLFIELTGDSSALHTDPIFASRSMFRTNVVHGMLPLAFLSCLDLPDKYQYELRAISGQFVRPLFISDVVKLQASIAKVNTEAATAELEYSLQANTGAIVTTGKLSLKYEPAVRVNNRNSNIDKGACLMTGLVTERALLLREIQAGDEEHLLFRITQPCLIRMKQIVTSGLGSSVAEECNLRGLTNFDCYSFLATCTLSTLVGMRLPGRYAIFLNFTTFFSEPVLPEKLYKLRGCVRFKSEARSAVVEDVSIHDGETNRNLCLAGRVGALVDAASHDPRTEMSK